MTVVGMSRTVLPPPGDTPALIRLATTLDEADVALVGPDGARAPLPDVVRQVLKDVVGAMVDGFAVTVTARDTQLTVQDAADLLGMDRLRLVRLLDHGAIPFEHRERQRVVKLADVLDYQGRVRAMRRADLDELAQAAGRHRIPGAQ